MIDVIKIGAYLSSLRKQNLLTQAEVAEHVNISHQAVSKWERGESLPDIGLLPAIANLFGVTVDDILRGERLGPPDPGVWTEPSDIAAEKIAAPGGNDLHAPVEAVFTAEQQGTPAVPSAPDEPIVPDKADMQPAMEKTDAPKQSHTGHGGDSQGRLHGEHIVKLAPFLATETIDELVRKQAENGQIDWSLVIGVAPFVSAEALHLLVDQVIATNDDTDMRHLVKLAPFLGKQKLEQLVRQAEEGRLNWETLYKLAPFLGKDTIGGIINRVIEGEIDVQHMVKLAPFIGKQNMSKLLEGIDPAAMSGETLVKLAPFIDKQTLAELLERYKPR